jgi:hypothetical protein
MAPPLTELVSALHLLMGDLDTDSRAFILNEAFPELILLAKGVDAERVRWRINSTSFAVKTALDLADGTSGLGAIGARRVNSELRSAERHIDELRNILRMR